MGYNHPPAMLPLHRPAPPRPAHGARALIGCVATVVLAAGTAAANGGGAAPQQAEADDDLDAAWQEALGLRPTEGAVAAEGAREDASDAFDAEPAFQPDGRGAAWHWDFELSGRQLGRAGLDDANGDVERRTYGIDLSVTDRRGRSGWRFDYGFDAHQYRFSGATGLLPGTDAPVESLVTHRFDAIYRGVLGGGWSGTALVGFDIGMETGADIGDALTWRALALAGRDVREDLAIQVGVFAFDRLEDDPFVVPAIGFDWRIDAATRLAIYGPRARFSYRYDDDAEFFVRAAYRNDQFRLDDSGPNPEGTFSDAAFSVVAGMRFDAGIGEGVLATARLEVYAGAIVDRELEFRIGDVEVGSSDVSSGVVFGLNYTFGL